MDRNMDLIFVWYLLSWILYATFAFLLAFMYAISRIKNLFELPKEERDKVVQNCWKSAGKWFQFGFLESLTVWIGMFASGTLDQYYTQTGILIIAGIIVTAILPKGAWEWILSFLKPLWDYFNKEHRDARTAIKTVIKEAKRQEIIAAKEAEIAAKEAAILAEREALEARRKEIVS